ncbi:MAG: single-stranded-DNA-specific exonuclease RecJ [Pseudomonadota bacterium]
MNSSINTASNIRPPTRRVERRIVPKINCLIERLLLARGVNAWSLEDRALPALLAPNNMKGINQAVEILSKAIQSNKLILIVGDYDVDGATSSALFMSGFKAMGAQRVHYFVPDRFKLGYGLSEAVVNTIAYLKPDLLITVDNGISSFAGVQRARDLGIEVIITDHHLPAEQLPNADAIVNPNQKDCTFSSKSLAGVGVAFYVLTALRRCLQAEQWFEKQGLEIPNLASYLDLVALGTVADLVPLDQNNRILVYQGLRRIRQQRTRPGIQALAEVAKKSLTDLTAADLGFGLAPRLNAAGRLEHMGLGIDCLLTDDIQAARLMAQELNTLNLERRRIEAEMKMQAEVALEKLQFQRVPEGIVLFDPRWHQGIIGILASRIKEIWLRPVIAFAATDDGKLKGSGRSIAGIHLKDILQEIAQANPLWLESYGGHAMAAGLTLHACYLELFIEEFSNRVARFLQVNNSAEIIFSDGILQPFEFSVSTAQAVEDAGPWGQNCPEPIFDGNFKVIQRRILADKHVKWTLKPEASNFTVDAIAFFANEELLTTTPQALNLAYKLSINHYACQSKVQLIAEHIEIADSLK